MKRQIYHRPELKRSIVTILLCISLISFNAPLLQAQTGNQSDQTIALSENALKFRKKIRKIGRFGDLTVVIKNGNELYGSVDSIGDETFFINEVDKKQKLEVNYEEIKNVWKNYGSSRARNGKRIRPRKRWIATAILLGVVVVLPIVLVGTSLDE
ncbi:MAG: hypothetical protein KDB79_05375 [Acidobacteria bacterium]|nr:hypothetical protein [Acidobacteriota bacterium]